APRAHGVILLARVAVRHDGGALHTVGTRGPADALSVVAARGADDLARQVTAALELVEVGQAAADLESAHGGVVLVLEPAMGTQAPAQQRPAVLRGGWEFAVDHLGGGLDVVGGGQMDHRETLPSMQVTLWPPTQMVPSAARSICTRPARPSAVPWAAM